MEIVASTHAMVVMVKRKIGGQPHVSIPLRKVHHFNQCIKSEQVLRISKN